MQIRLQQDQRQGQLHLLLLVSDSNAGRLQIMRKVEPPSLVVAFMLDLRFLTHYFIISGFIDAGEALNWCSE